MCGQRWGLLERIFLSESRKLTATTGERHLDKRTLPLVEGKSKFQEQCQGQEKGGRRRWIRKDKGGQRRTADT